MHTLPAATSPATPGHSRRGGAAPLAAAAAACLFLSWLSPLPVLAQQFGDYGDAPEGVVAYPNLGVIGAFPTCVGGPAGFVWHNAIGDLHWGPSVDYEFDGNAGFCPQPPYDRDECWGLADLDGGLTAPDPYSINAALVVVECGPAPAAALGASCDLVPVVAGGAFDADIVNNEPFDAFVNVLFDWDQSGAWGGVSFCGVAAAAPEHAIVNWPVPPGYIGPLSGLFPPAIQIGPNDGFIWMRLSLTDEPVPQNWAGDGLFEFGESEDYLIRVDPDQEEQFGDYGDAPEGAMAYPGIPGAFPTCRLGGPAGFVFHGASDLVFLGPIVDWEFDGNAGICPPAPYDQDECDALGGDAGFVGPTVFSFLAGVPAVCGAPGQQDLVGCFTARWGVDLDIMVNNFTNQQRWVNVLADWDDDGRWTGVVTVCPDGDLASEHVLVDFPVPPLFAGPLSLLVPPDFTVGWPPLNFAWLRFTISDAPVGPAWDGEGVFGDGETEDYLLRVAPAPVDAPELGQGPAVGSGLRFESVRPNPMEGETTVRLSTERGGILQVAAYDAAGRRVGTIAERAVGAGVHSIDWDGRDADRRRLAAGVYFLRATLGAESANRKIVIR